MARHTLHGRESKTDGGKQAVTVAKSVSCLSATAPPAVYAAKLEEAGKPAMQRCAGDMRSRQQTAAVCRNYAGGGTSKHKKAVSAYTETALQFFQVFIAL